MKTCPACNTQYTDDTLVYCLQDGSPLTGGGRDTPTVVMDDADTVVRGRQWQQSEVTKVGARGQRPKGSKTAIAVVLTAVAMLFIFGVIGIAAWLFFKNSNGPVNVNVSLPNNANLPGRANATSTPTPSPLTTGTPTVSTTISPTPNTGTGTTTGPTPFNDEQERREVSQRVERWASMLESRDLNAYMDNYAPTVDYYRRRNASSAFVRSDKARAFSLYSSMNVNVSNMAVSVGGLGDMATATFDKEWSFSGRDTSSGKVRAQLEFRKINGRWLITGERDVRVYYTR